MIPAIWGPSPYLSPVMLSLRSEFTCEDSIHLACSQGHPTSCKFWWLNWRTIFYQLKTLPLSIYNQTFHSKLLSDCQCSSRQLPKQAHSLILCQTHRLRETDPHRGENQVVPSGQDLKQCGAPESQYHRPKVGQIQHHQGLNRSDNEFLTTDSKHNLQQF